METPEGAETETATITDVTKDKEALLKGHAAMELEKLRSRQACQASAAEAYLVEIEKARKVLTRISGKGFQINGDPPPEDDWPTEARWPARHMWELFQDAVDVESRIGELEDRFREWGVLPPT